MINILFSVFHSFSPDLYPSVRHIEICLVSFATQQVTYSCISLSKAPRISHLTSLLFICIITQLGHILLLAFFQWRPRSALQFCLLKKNITD